MPHLHPSSSRHAPGRPFLLHPSHRRAFSLLELLTVILILPVFLYLSTKIFHTTFRTTQGAQQLLSAQSTFDAATRALRSDVWSAKTVTMPDPHTLTLTPAEGPAITWTQRDGTLMRNNAHHYTLPAPRSLSLTLDGPDVLLHLNSPPHNEDVRLTSPLAEPRRPS